MRTMICGSILLVAAALAGCLKSNTFQCTDNQSCGGGTNVCESQGVCSVLDSACDSGRRFDSSAGSLAGTCVGGNPNPDGGVDSNGDGPVPDATPVDAPTGCQVGYNTIPNGNPTHKYKAATANNWLALATTTCRLTGGYLAIPDNAAELLALHDLTGQNDTWVGVHDRNNEGVIQDVFNNPYTAIAIGANKQPDDCGLSPDGVKIDMHNCAEAHNGVCECDQ